MPPRRPLPSVDPDRFMKRVEDRIDQSFTLMLEEIEKVKLEVRKGNLQTELHGNRLADLELQVIETREQMQKNKRQNEATETAVVASSVATVAAAANAGGKVWKTWAGIVVTVSAAFVAIVAFFNNLPKFVRGATEVAVGVFNYLWHHK